VIALVALVIGVIVAGCGGSSSTSSTGSTSNAARETAFLNYAQCMRQHGVAVSDPTVGANGTVELPRPTDFSSGQTPTAAQRAQMQTARTACSSNLKGITFGLGGASNPAFQAALLKYAQCMRTNGYNMPDPTFNSTPGSGTGTGGTGARGAFGGLNRNSPTFQKANTACRPILQSAGFGGGGGGGGGGFGGGGGSGGTGGTSGGTLG
jgi:hypothetical protein